MVQHAVHSPPISVVGKSGPRHDVQRDGQVALIIAQVLVELGTTLSEDVSLMAAGLDSIAATEISRMLHDKFRIELPATLLFDHPTARSMARFVSSKLQKHSTL